MDIQIRRVEPDDHHALKRVYEYPGVIAGTLQLPYPSVELWRERVSATSKTSIMLVACSDDELVGHLGLFMDVMSHRRRHIAGLGMAVADPWQGKGVGTALLAAAVDVADNWWNILRLELDVYTDNQAAIALYQKTGFVIEGTKKSSAFRNGKYVDAHIMARLKAPA